MEGYVSKESLKALVKHYGQGEDSLTQCCWVFSQMATEGPDTAKENPEKLGDMPSPEKCKDIILHLLDEEKKTLTELKEIVIENEDLQMEAKALSLEVPAASDKILRYETTIERQMYRAIDELERLQNRRKGEVLNFFVLMLQTQFCETKPPNSWNTYPTEEGCSSACPGSSYRRTVPLSLSS